MGSNARGGITRSGSSPNFSYTVRTNMGNKPVNFVTWLDAARYVNWLHNGKPTGAQGNSTTEQGAYDLTVATPGVNATRQSRSALVPPDAGRMERRGVHRSDQCLVLHLSDPQQHGADESRPPIRRVRSPIRARTSRTTTTVRSGTHRPAT